MAEVDLQRWATLLHQLADSRYALRGANSQLAEAQERALRLSAARDRCADDPSLGHGRPLAIIEVAQQRLADAEHAAATAQAELSRIQQRVGEVAGRFTRLSDLVRAAASWAATQGVILPTAGDSVAATVPPSRGTNNPFALTMASAAATAPISTAAPAPMASAAIAAGGPIGRIVDRVRSVLGAGSPA